MPLAPDVLRDLERAVLSQLDQLAEPVRAAQVPVRTHSSIGLPADEIVRYAREAGADLIVMGTHGRSGWRHALLGSVAEKVVRRARCPVLTVGPPRAEEARV
jgi:nucleotide-binding universal stress UspA family protein